MSTQENILMGKSQFLLSNPAIVRAHREAVGMIGIKKVRISIRARRFDILHKQAGYMTDALFSIIKTLDSHGRSIVRRKCVRRGVREKDTLSFMNKRVSRA